MDYEQVLRDVAKMMVRLKKPDRLLRMITRFIDKNFQLDHTSIVVWDAYKSRYHFVHSKGHRRFPSGLVRIDSDHPLIAWFSKSRRPVKVQSDYLLRSDVEKQIEQHKAARPDTIRALQIVLSAMKTLKAELLIPSYFKNDLLGILILGSKKSKQE